MRQRDLTAAMPQCLRIGQDTADDPRLRGPASQAVRLGRTHAAEREEDATSTLMHTMQEQTKLCKNGARSRRVWWMCASLVLRKKKCRKGQKAFITLGSPVVPLLSTSKADSGLASEFRWDRAIYTAYERMLKVRGRNTNHQGADTWTDRIRSAHSSAHNTTTTQISTSKADTHTSSNTL